ncbi:MAG: hypothetical protein ACJAV5_001197 [Vicingaceae bacterium]|jgi:hypothetical protein
MESQKELNIAINAATSKIRNEYPELLKYIDEIPEHLLYQTKKGVSNKELKDYLNSLTDLLKNYEKEHGA